MAPRSMAMGDSSSDVLDGNQRFFHHDWTHWIFGHVSPVGVLFILVSAKALEMGLLVASHHLRYVAVCDFPKISIS